MSGPQRWMVLVALGAPLIQTLLMSVVGYPVMSRLPNGMERFRRSGFSWWLATLGLITVASWACVPALLAETCRVPVEGVGRNVGAGILALAVLIAIEVVGRLLVGHRAAYGRERYEDALPEWARGPVAEPLILTVLAVGEEVVYRAVALMGLIVVWGVPAPIAVIVSASAFGVAHWYYGPVQMLIKSLLGVVFGLLALWSGWAVSACVHVALNLVLLLWSRRPEPSLGPVPDGSGAAPERGES